MTKYIYHSENMKTTCDKCRKNDGKVFYDIKDIPELPVHPNCKCFIEVVEDNSNKNNQCDCKNRFEILLNNLQNITDSSASMIKTIDKEISECISDKKEILQNEFYSIRNKTNELIKSANELITNIKATKEFSFDPTFHTKDKCPVNKELTTYSKDVTRACNQLIEISKELKDLKEKKKEEKTLANVVNINNTPVDIKELFYYKLSNKASVSLPVATACLQDALHDFKYAKENKNAVILNSRDDVKNKDIRNALIEVGVPKNSRGVYYDINSYESNRIAASKEIKEFISKNYKKLLDASISKENNIVFKTHRDKDLYYALHTCKMINPKISSDGYFEAAIIDYYDFKYQEGKTFGDDVNNWGYAMQEKGILENYYVIFSIKSKV